MKRYERRTIIQAYSAAVMFVIFAVLLKNIWFIYPFVACFAIGTVTAIVVLTERNDWDD